MGWGAAGWSSMHRPCDPTPLAPTLPLHALGASVTHMHPPPAPPPLHPTQAHADKMAYTIIRPGGLQSEPATGNGVLTADAGACGAITREDTAALVVKALFSSKTDNKVLSAVDKNKVSTPGPVEPFAL